jgi:protein-S-isoprenylcysteine O-methyltransferase Ste14
VAASSAAVLAVARPYLETHPVRFAWLGVAVAAGLIELAGALRRRPEAVRRDQGSLLVLRACVIPAVVLLILSPRIAAWADLRPPLPFVVAGIVIFAAGEALRIWAKTALGRYFTYTVQTSSDQPVITSGPYRFVRHPSYTGLWLMMIGIGFAWANWLGLVVLAVAALGALIYRIRVEERALTSELGESYRRYAEGRKRLVPFVW